MSDFSANLRYDLGSKERAEESIASFNTSNDNPRVSASVDDKYLVIVVDSDSSEELRVALGPVFDSVAAFDEK